MTILPLRLLPDIDEKSLLLLDLGFDLGEGMDGEFSRLGENG